MSIGVSLARAHLLRNILPLVIGTLAFLILLRALTNTLIFNLLGACSIDLPVDTALLVKVVAGNRSFLLFLGLMVFEALHLFFSLSFQPLKVLLSLFVGGPILRLSQEIN